VGAGDGSFEHALQQQSPGQSTNPGDSVILVGHRHGGHDCSSLWSTAAQAREYDSSSFDLMQIGRIKQKSTVCNLIELLEIYAPQLALSKQPIRMSSY